MKLIPAESLYLKVEQRVKCLQCSTCELAHMQLLIDFLDSLMHLSPLVLLLGWIQCCERLLNLLVERAKSFVSLHLVICADLNSYIILCIRRIGAVNLPLLNPVCKAHWEKQFRLGLLYVSSPGSR